jgi:hypothetical protein
VNYVEGTVQFNNSDDDRERDSNVMSIWFLYHLIHFKAAIHGLKKGEIGFLPKMVRPDSHLANMSSSQPRVTEHMGTHISGPFDPFSNRSKRRLLGLKRWSWRGGHI